MDIAEHNPTLLDKLHWQEMYALTAVFKETNYAHAVVSELDKHHFPMDQISVITLPRGQSSDFLGVSYNNEHKRTVVWAENGALWGALIGLVIGTSGLLFVPGIGLLLTLGPVIDLIAGAALGSGIMAGAAQVTQLTHALHQVGIPKNKTDYFHDVLLAGKTILILHYAKEDKTDWQKLINWSGAESVQLFSGNVHQETTTADS